MDFSLKTEYKCRKLTFCDWHRVQMQTIVNYVLVRPPLLQA